MLMNASLSTSAGKTGTSLTGARRISLWLAAIASVVLIGSGCAGRRSDDSAFRRVFTPHTPSLFSSLSALLLTNSPGFSALATIRAPENIPGEAAREGHLLARGPQLVFAPTHEPSPGKRTPRGGFSFLWKAPENRGFVLSEALQGYAPISARLAATNLVVDPGPGTPAPEKIAGYRCHLTHAIIHLGDGSVYSYEVARADELNGFPVRIRSAGNTPAFDLTLSKITTTPPPADVFAVPDGFAPYNSPEALVDELAARQLNLKRKIGDTPLEAFPGMGQPRGNPY
jgi:hypothetical protein